MRLTIRQFNREYQIYKDDFDLEILLKRTQMTFAQLKSKNEDW